jgi:acyl carrier protein
LDLEEQFHLTLPDDVVRSLRTVRQIVEAIERTLAAPGPAAAPLSGTD